MNRESFLDELGRQLAKSEMSSEEANRTLEWYDEVISDRIKEGETEEQAVSAMGNPEDIADEIAGSMPPPAGRRVEKRSRNERISEIFEGVSEIRIEAGSLDVTLRPSDDRQVTVEYYKYDRLVCSFSPENGRLTAARKSDGYLPPFLQTGSITVFVPRDFDGPVGIRSSSGDVNIENLSAKGSLSVHTASGDIDALGLKTGGDLELQSASGDIDVNRAAAGGRMSIRSASGDIAAHDLVSGDKLGMTAASGDIEVKKVTAGGNFEAQTASGDIEVIDCAAGMKMRLSSASGDIVAKSAAAGEAFDFQTVSGDINGTLEGCLADYTVHTVTRSGDSNLPSYHNSGNKTLSVKTLSGDINLRFSDKA